MAKTVLSPLSAGRVTAADGLITKTKAGVLVDGDFTTAAADGLVGVDTTNHHLYYRSGGVWRREPQLKYCIVRRTTNQVINNNTVTSVVWESEVADTDGMWTSGANVTIQTAGLYRCTLQLEWTLAATVTTRLLASIRLGGVIIAADERTSGTTEGQRQNISVDLPLVATNVIDASVFQTNAAAGTRTLAGTATAYAVRMSVVRLGPS